MIDIDKYVGKSMCTKTCSKDGCAKRHHAKGLCKGHYNEEFRWTSGDKYILTTVQRTLLTAIAASPTGVFTKAGSTITHLKQGTLYCNKRVLSALVRRELITVHKNKAWVTIKGENHLAASSKGQ